MMKLSITLLFLSALYLTGCQPTTTTDTAVPSGNTTTPSNQDGGATGGPNGKTNMNPQNPNGSAH